MSEKYDLRIVKTRKALFDAFLELVSEKPFDAITVNEICKRALVRRATFYNHFADKYDFFAAFVHQLAEEFREKSLSGDRHLTPYQNDGNTSLTPLDVGYEIFLLYAEFLKQHKPMIDNVLDSNVFHLLLDITSDEIYRSVLLEFKSFEGAGHTLNIPAETIASFLAGGLIQISRNRLIIASEEERVELLSQIDTLLHSIQIS